jgi:hypothetical protein
MRLPHSGFVQVQFWETPAFPLGAMNDNVLYHALSEWAQEGNKIRSHDLIHDWQSVRARSVYTSLTLAPDHSINSSWRAQIHPNCQAITARFPVATRFKFFLINAEAVLDFRSRQSRECSWKLPRLNRPTTQPKHGGSSSCPPLQVD